MRVNLKTVLLSLVLATIPTLLIWLPFFFRLKSFWSIPLPQNGMATIVANYDGPLFLAVAKTFYNPEAIKASFQFNLPVEYYAAHFPLYPLLIRVFSQVLGYPYSMLFVTLVSSTAALFYFRKLASLYVGGEKLNFLTFFFAIFPARWLIVKSVGSAEPLFVAAILASSYYFIQKKYVFAGIFGAIAQLTKSPAILLFIAYLFSYLYPRFKESARTFSLSVLKNLEVKEFAPLLMIPAALLSVFALYKITYNDFFAYFRSGDNIHLFFPPFGIFNYSAPWVGTFWLEEIIFVYLFGALGLFRLISQKRYEMAWFVGIFFISTLFVSHRDLIRYSLPIVPFLIIAFSETISKRQFKLVLALLAIPIYLFSLAYISQNVMPISNWAPFL